MSGENIRMFGPLTFQETIEENDLIRETRCFLCEDTFNLKLGFTLFLKHCFEVHYLVIEDVQNIPNMHEYVTYWREKFDLKGYERIVPSISVDNTEGRVYYLLSALMKEDAEVRHRLKLNSVLRTQEMERTDGNFKRNCLLCRLEFEGLRSDYLNHLSTAHNLHLGNPHNLVYIDEFINEVEKKLEDMLCLYCERQFPSRTVLKEHMRKKMHKCVNPKNKYYDKFYIVNYLECNKSWEEIDAEDDELSLEPNSDIEYADWKESESPIVCLFCDYKDSEVGSTQKHLVDAHRIDFKSETEQLDFYKKVKLVNYIRRQIKDYRCVYCDKSFKSKEENSEHMVREDHLKLPECIVFDQPEYFFPTFENDTFLYSLDVPDD